GVDDAVDEPHARDREPELLAVELERQRLRRRVARVGVRRDRNELCDGRPPCEHVFDSPAERVLGADTGDRRGRGVPVLDDAVVVGLADPHERVCRVVGDVDLEPVEPQLQRPRERLEQRRVVVDDQDPARYRVIVQNSGSSGGGPVMTGSWIRKLAPRPPFGSTEIRPPCSLRMLYVIESPSPVPVPTSFVVKNGSKMRCSTSRAIPGPVSANLTLIHVPSRLVPIRIVFPRDSESASRALVSRLMNTCSSWIALPSTISSSLQRSSLTSIPRMRSCSCICSSERSITSSTSTASSVTGAGRPNVRRCEMIAVAFRTCSIAFSSSPSTDPFSKRPSRTWSRTLPTKRPMLF